MHKKIDWCISLNLYRTRIIQKAHEVQEIYPIVGNQLPVWKTQFTFFMFHKYSLFSIKQIENKLCIVYGLKAVIVL